MDSKVVLITGSNSGVGRAVAHLFAKKGHKVVIHGGSNQERVDRVVAECKVLSPNNSKAFGLVVDFRNPKNAAKLVEKTLEHFGCLDVLVHCAGLLMETQTDQTEALLELYEYVKSVELDSPVNIILSAIEHMKKSSKNPAIVTVTSSMKPYAEFLCIGTAKAGLDMFIKTLALKQAPVIRLNSVYVGAVDSAIKTGVSEDYYQSWTDKIPLKRFARSDEIAKAVYYLASSEAAYVTGTSLTIDGGMSLV